MSTKGRKFAPWPLNPSEACSMVKAARTPRDRALLILLWRGGLRANEVASLDLEHVRFLEDGTAEVYVNKPKGVDRGAPKRVVGLDKRSADLLATWVAKRGSDPGPFIRTRTGKRLAPTQLKRAVKNSGARARIARRVHPHALRHSFAAGLYDEGFGVRHIQVALGHNDLDTTQKYLSNIGCSEMAKLTRRREW